jgi:hypothetical protein
MKMVKSNFKQVNQMENNLFNDIKSNKGSIYLNLGILDVNLPKSLSMNSKMMNLKHYVRVSYSNEPLSAQIWALQALKAVNSTFSANIVGFIRTYNEHGDGHYNNSPIASINVIFKEKSAILDWNSHNCSPTKAGRCISSPSYDMGSQESFEIVCGNSFSVPGYPNIDNLKFLISSLGCHPNQLNPLGGIK